MSGWLQALLLGVIQGLTEFLPVSSSGHLVLAQAWLGEQFVFLEDAVAFDLVLHVGTLLPVVWFYRTELKNILQSVLEARHGCPGGDWKAWVFDHEDRRFALFVVVGTVPLVVIGLGFRKVFENLFHNVTAVCIALLVTGSVLLLTRVTNRVGYPRRHLSVGLALAIGLAQSLAITPGISRSGSTIAVALLLGVERSEAARFSFLLSIPAIMGAVVIVLKDGVGLNPQALVALAIGFLSSMLVGYAALRLLVVLVRRGGLYRFAFYLIPLAVMGLWSTGRS